MHINVSELTGIKFAIFSLLPLQIGSKHLRVMTDNSTAISYINREGRVRFMLCNNVTTKIWEFCIKRGVYISAVHSPWKENITANLASREFWDSHEWMFSLKIFKYLVELFQIADIDVFASRLNKQLPKYASWMPDPNIYIIDCMRTSWENTYIYAFPSFSMIWITTKKIEKKE